MIAVVVTARPSWAKLEPVCRALQARGAAFGIIACGSALLERYGKVIDVIRQQGYPVVAECWNTYEGATRLTSAKETGALLTELSSRLLGVQARSVVVCADRHEVLAVAQSASYLHLPLVHLQGGERSGSIDDRVRDAVTQLATYHCVSTQLAQYRVYGLTGRWETIYHTGCPSIDMAKEALTSPPVTFEELGGVGPRIDLNHPFMVILQHPVTQESDDAADHLRITLAACRQVRLPQLYFWPGQDAGAETMAKVVREYREAHPAQSFHAVRNLPPLKFLRLLSQATVLVGNSSAGIRECSYLGTPVVNIGSRQQGRERAKNVVDVPHEVAAIREAILAAQAHGRYPSSTLYGTGHAGTHIAAVLHVNGLCV